jgi:hypothetical protein
MRSPAFGGVAVSASILPIAVFGSTDATTVFFTFISVSFINEKSPKFLSAQFLEAMCPQRGLISKEFLVIPAICQ